MSLESRGRVEEETGIERVLDEVMKAVDGLKGPQMGKKECRAWKIFKGKMCGWISTISPLRPIEYGSLLGCSPKCPFPPQRAPKEPKMTSDGPQRALKGLGESKGATKSLQEPQKT